MTLCLVGGFLIGAVFNGAVGWRRARVERTHLSVCGREVRLYGQGIISVVQPGGILS